MTQFPIFNKGWGKLDANVLNQLFEMVQNHEDKLRSMTSGREDQIRALRAEWMFIRIDSSEQDGSNEKRWKYYFTEMLADGTGGENEDWYPKDGGFVGNETNETFARNIQEYGNSTASDTIGVGWDITDDDNATLTIEPIRDDMVLLARLVRGKNNDVQYWFDAPNPITITCTGGGG